MQGDGAIGMFTWLGCALMPGRVRLPHCILYTLLLKIWVDKRMLEVYAKRITLECITLNFLSWYNYAQFHRPESRDKTRLVLEQSMGFVEG